jgi:hypothetical protein
VSELLVALGRLAKERQIQEPGWPVKIARRIRLAIKTAKDWKLSNRRYGEYTRPWRERAQIPPPRLAAHLVECKIKGKPWSTALRKYSEDARAAISTRAAEILSGDKAKARKNFIEDHASKIAAELRREWFSSAGKSGRPLGKRTHPGDNWLSLDEIVTTIVPIIEKATGTSLKPVAISKNEIKSSAFAALVAAVKEEHPADVESVNRTLARLRAQVRAQNAPNA